MPPKKKVAAAEGGEAEGGVCHLLIPPIFSSSLTDVRDWAFRWTLENANKVNQVLPTRTGP